MSCLPLAYLCTEWRGRDCQGKGEHRTARRYNRGDARVQDCRIRTGSDEEGESAERQHHQCGNAPARHRDRSGGTCRSRRNPELGKRLPAGSGFLAGLLCPRLQQTEQVAELQARIDELEMQNAMAQQQTQQPDEMELLERSYQLAAQYMGNGNGNYQAPPQSDEKGKRNVQPVQNVTHNVVSTLSAATNERGFNTSVGMKRSVGKNTIAAVIAGNQSVTNGQSVKLRTTEPMWIGNRLIPRNTVVVGAARLQDERLEIEITSVETNGSIYEVDLKVYDSDGQEGINIPNSMESDALHEIGANMGSTMGSSINISTDAGAQIASDVGRGLINGVSQYLTKKMRTVKVHLKAGHRVMLYQPENN